MKKKYLVILAGSPRGGVNAWKSLFKNVINHLNADLALCTTDNYAQDTFLFKKAKHIWLMKNPENFEQYYEHYFDGNWREYLLLGKELGLYESGTIHFAFKDFIIRNYKEILGEYEFIIYTRFDQYYVDLHPDFYDDKLYIPTGEDYFGICDRHAVFKSNKAEDYFSIVKYIDSPEAIQDPPKFLNCESVYRQHLQAVSLSDNIERFSRSSFTVALKHEPTNWRVPDLKVFFSKNLMIKYPDEFIAAMKNKFKNNSLFKALFNNMRLNLLYFYLILRRLVGSKLKRKQHIICSLHGEYFTSNRYKDLKTCPECN